MKVEELVAVILTVLDSYVKSEVVAEES